MSNELQTVKLVRKPFYADAVQVTENNMIQVAEWCGGKVEKFSNVWCVEVPVRNAQQKSQTRAFVGSHVLKVGDSFKVFSQKALDSTFEPVKLTAVSSSV
jgi:hypothetical protein